MRSAFDFSPGAAAVPEVAKLLCISSAAVRLMIHRGDLPGKKWEAVPSG